MITRKSLRRWKARPEGFAGHKPFMTMMAERHVYPNWLQWQGHEWYYTLHEGRLLCLDLNNDGEGVYDLIEIVPFLDTDEVPRLAVFAGPEEAERCFEHLEEALMQEAL